MNNKTFKDLLRQGVKEAHESSYNRIGEWGFLKENALELDDRMEEAAIMPGNLGGGKVQTSRDRYPGGAGRGGRSQSLSKSKKEEFEAWNKLDRELKDSGALDAEGEDVLDRQEFNKIFAMAKGDEARTKEYFVTKLKTGGAAKPGTEDVPAGALDVPGTGADAAPRQKRRKRDRSGVRAGSIPQYSAADAAGDARADAASAKLPGPPAKGDPATTTIIRQALMGGSSKRMQYLVRNTLTKAELPSNYAKPLTPIILDLMKQAVTAMKGRTLGAPKDMGPEPGEKGFESPIPDDEGGIAKTSGQLQENKNNPYADNALLQEVFVETMRKVLKKLKKHENKK